jgi:hypothetical protein
MYVSVTITLNSPRDQCALALFFNYSLITLHSTCLRVSLHTHIHDCIDIKLVKVPLGLMRKPENSLLAKVTTTSTLHTETPFS